MPENTTGFKFTEEPALPSSDASAANLNAAVEKAIVRNIAPQAVQSEHIHPNIAGLGLGGGGGNPLNVKADNKSIEVTNDALQVKEGGIKAEHIADGAVTQEKLDEALSNVINDIKEGVFETLFKVGDYFITHNETNPSKRFGGQWELVKDRFLIGAGGEYDILTAGGEKEHTLTVDEIPAHAHSLQKDIVADWYGGGEHLESSGGNLERGGSAPTTGNTGGGKAHNNMPPYKAVYIWVKISDTDEEEGEES